MAKRINIGLVYSYNEQWIGGTYYILNLIKALNYLEDSKKPRLTVFIENENKLDLIKEVNYPYLRFFNLNQSLGKKEKLLRILLKIFRIKFGPRRWLIGKKIDTLYQTWFDKRFDAVQNKAYWVADFQEFRLKHLFTQEQADSRSSFPRYIAQTRQKLILSSHDAENDFKTFFPDYVCKVNVLHFAVVPPVFKKVSIDDLKIKYNIKNKYFICCNQFWSHKNHIIIFKALNNLINKHSDIQVVFTGKNFDYRNNDYFDSLLNYLKDNQLESYVNFLGFIEREHQYVLMQNSLSIIQPSLFEGWSTTVEDAKFLNKHIVLSNIKVHLEQIDSNVSFFDPYNEDQLSGILSDIYTNGSGPVVINDYSKNIYSFASNFVKIIST
jgi:glycosyltransferase involved in cell wall biosynthesis